MAKRMKRNRGERKRGYSPKSKDPDKNLNNGDNDVSWYTRYPSLVKAASSIIFNQPYGYTPEVIDATGTIDDKRDCSAIPGVVAYKYVPMYVEDASAQSAVNIATKNLYTYIRHANSGAANYESSDLMQYLITVMGLITAVEQCKRDIRLIPTFNPLNKYVFSAALRAVGYSEANITTMRQTQALNVATLNQIIAQLNTFKIPRDLPLLDRHVWLSSNVWKDESSEKCSYYLFYNNVIPHYDWANRTVEVHDFGTLDLPGRLALIQGEINNLLAYEDIGIMLGDILKAYKQEGCRIISPINLGEVCDAAYSEEALSQFTNAFVFGTQSYDYEIVQNTANSQLLEMQSTGHQNGHLTVNILTNSVTNTTLTNIHLNPILTIDSNEPDSDKVIIATRFMIAGDINVTNTYEFVYDSTSFPTEIIAKATVWAYVENNGTDVLYGYDFQSMNIAIHSTQAADPDDLAELLSEQRICAWLDKVSFNPTLYFIRNDINNDGGDKELEINYKFLGMNWIPVSADWLHRLDQGCKQSLYSLPMFKLLESN